MSVASSCEHGNEPASSVKGGEFPTRPSDSFSRNLLRGSSYFGGLNRARSLAYETYVLIYIYIYIYWITAIRAVFQCQTRLFLFVHCPTCRSLVLIAVSIPSCQISFGLTFLTFRWVQISLLF
jgi:hypothetical protein